MQRKSPNKNPKTRDRAKVKGKLATHAMTFLICGLKARWKQVVAYQLTSDSFNGEVMAHYIKDLLRAVFKTGLNPRSVTMDMGPGNQAV